MTVTNDHIYDFPASYDGTKPFPLLIGFHAAGNPIDQIEGMTNNTDFATNYVRAFPKSAGNEWVYNTDLASKAYKVYDDLMANYCIDTSRVFATGHSSGAQMIVQILTHSDAAKHMNFKAVAPVAASDYGAITVPIPVMYIQGKMDNVRGNDGAATVARFRTANMCTTTSMPYSAGGGLPEQRHDGDPRLHQLRAAARCRRSGARTTIPSTATRTTACPASPSRRCTTSSGPCPSGAADNIAPR